jgi:hypothetical protein
MLTHVVFFKLQDPTAENMLALQQKLLTLKNNVPQVRDLEVGVDVLRSPRSFDVALIVRLDSLADLDGYQNDPYHQEVLAYVKSVISEAKAVDFET